MRLVSVAACRPGMKLGKSIYNEDGRTLLSENAELTEKILERLNTYGIKYIYIQDSRTDDIVIEDILSDETRAMAMGLIRSTFRQLMGVSGKRKLAGALHLEKTFSQLLNAVIDDLSNHKEAMIMLMNMNASDYYLYQHSLNVCVYSTLLGMANGYGRDEIQALSLGALLHDIGKTQINQKVLNKPGKLTDAEYKEVQRHAELGYYMLKDEPNIPLISAHCAYQHHERLDGSGYPRGIQGGEIHEYAKLIGLVDVFDAMTSHRVYRPAMLPHQAIESIYTGSGTLYSKELIELFRDKIAFYPLGLSVRLSTGEQGVVVDINSSFPQRPVVRILQDAEGTDLTVPHEIDLSKKLSVMITDVDVLSSN
ncbi:HD-GYP domain-containing protein [Ferviditalea candida]|uniref:HD-GYP domain-containing protein n=1 Tax=Ferviditalea candida TaxID=3108399 RepID=A0ABU5ZKP5_9BACL|nr:HD-GYP domain-containing protein [Paenibacillaceae bacterium T2]